MSEPASNSGAKTNGRVSDEIIMADAQNEPVGYKHTPVTYKNPRRTSPENSITLRHHRLAREASERNAMEMGIPIVSVTRSTRRNSSDESNETTASNPRRWFDRANRNLTSTMDSSMDIDPPFFQKETESSNEEGHMVPSQSPAYRYVQSRDSGLLRPGLTHSSSAGDYRSVIDDLTIENKRLKEELKRYRQMGPDSLRRDKLFEVKVHGLPSRKKRELEAALRDFTTSIDGSSTGASHSRRKDKSKGNKGNSSSKHASSSSGSNSRPHQTDSAYASMSTGAGSSGPSLTSKLSRHQSDVSAERYLPDVPEGLLPRPTVLSEKEKKKLIVRRLEELFTGKAVGHTRHASLSLVPPAIDEDVELAGAENAKPPISVTTEASREAQILPRSRGKEGYPRGDVSPNSNEDRIESRESGNNTGKNTGRKEKMDSSPPTVNLPEQRATRPLDLDPDRPSIPSDNMHYIRHLGLVAPEERKFSATDVSVDAEGWVYLNLLSDMAQLHMFNVTPSFIRAAVSEKSRLFQLSPDGRKIRWRGGAEGTRFSSDSSGSNSQRGSSSPDTDGANLQDRRKKQKTQSSGNEVVSEPTKLGPQVSSSSDEFHYKPMFAHHQTLSSDELPSMDDDERRSSTSSPEDPNLGTGLRWNNSWEISRASQRKRRRDGAIIYYTGAPFCTDLSGDFGDISPDHDGMVAAGPTAPPELQRSGSASSIPFKPLSNYMSHRAMMDLDFAPPDAASDSTDEILEMQADFPWSNKTQSPVSMNLEASGIGGVSPEDHFVVVVSTRRPKFIPNEESIRRPSLVKMDSGETTVSKETTESLVSRLATMSTRSPMPRLSPIRKLNTKVEVEYLSGKVHRLPPAPLPAPAFFFGSTSSSFETALSDSESANEDLISRGLLICPGQLYSPDGELSSNDEEDEHCDDDGDDEDSGSTSPDEAVEIANVVPDIARRSSTAVSNPTKLTTGSSVATAGGAVSHGYTSTEET